MNIFVVDRDPIISARNLCDKHVVKMIVETAQMLSTVHLVIDGTLTVEKTTSGRNVKRYLLENQEWNNKLCKSVMVNHPCTQWAYESAHNYIWLWEHGNELCREYTYRYNKIHSMNDLYTKYLVQMPNKLACKFPQSRTPFAQAMPEQYKNVDPVHAYRQYYIHEKNKFAKWTRREVPLWYSQGLVELNTSKGQMV